MIWKEAAPEPEPRVITFSLSLKNQWQLNYTLPCHQDIPIFKSLCHGSRYAVRAYTIHSFTVQSLPKRGYGERLPSKKHLWLNLETSTINLTRQISEFDLFCRTSWFSSRPPLPWDPGFHLPAHLPWDANSSITAQLQNLIIDLRLWRRKDFQDGRWDILRQVKSRKCLTFSYWTKEFTGNLRLKEARHLQSIIGEICEKIRSQDPSYITPEIIMCVEMHPLIEDRLDKQFFIIHAS